MPARSLYLLFRLVIHSFIDTWVKILVFTTGTEAPEFKLTGLDNLSIYVCCLITKHSVKLPARLLSIFCILALPTPVTDNPNRNLDSLLQT